MREYGERGMSSLVKKLKRKVKRSKREFEIARGARGLYKPDRQTNFFNRIQSEVKYKKWYFGHYHMDYNVSPSEILLNKKIIPLGGMLKEER